MFSPHKSWKLIRQTPLKNYRSSDPPSDPNFGFEIYETIDLTDPRTAIITSEQSREPDKITYQLYENTIAISEGKNLRIVSLTESKMTAILEVDISARDFFILGDLVELEYAAIK